MAYAWLGWKRLPRQNIEIAAGVDLEAVRTLFSEPRPSSMPETSPPSSPLLQLDGGFDHAAIECLDVQKSCSFYCQVLGFKRIPRPPFSSRGYWLAHAGIKLHMVDCPAAERRAILSAEQPQREMRGWKGLPGSGDHLAFITSDLEACAQALHRAGVRFKRAPKNCAGSEQLFVFDPDGNAIEISTQVHLEYQF